MFKAEADLGHHRMVIIADQALNNGEFDYLIEQIRRESRKLEPGWVAAVDLRGMWIEDLFFCEQAKLLQIALLESGACKIGTLLDSTSIQMFLGQASLKTHTHEVTQRFFNEKSWIKFIDEK